MCLITKQKKPIILEEDLIVYKKVKNNEHNDDPSDHFTSSTVGFDYILGQEYKTDLVFDKKPESFADSRVSEHYGFYGSTGKTLKQVAKKMTNVHEGFHFYVEKKRIAAVWDYCLGADIQLSTFESVLKCKIPKGSEVFYDETGLGVANEIHILEEELRVSMQKFNLKEYLQGIQLFQSFRSYKVGGYIKLEEDLW